VIIPNNEVSDKQKLIKNALAAAKQNTGLAGVQHEFQYGVKHNVLKVSVPLTPDAARALSNQRQTEPADIVAASPEASGNSIEPGKYLEVVLEEILYVMKIST